MNTVYPDGCVSSPLVDSSESPIEFMRAHNKESLRTVLEQMGTPQSRLRFVHVTGTNGKGSTCAMLNAVLMSAGYRVGMFTSPHIETSRERIQVQGEPIPRRMYTNLMSFVKRYVRQLEMHFSPFQLHLTASFFYFLFCKCDIVILEAGIGGKNDATNVIDTTEAAVITNIGLDHTHILGDTIEQIAKDKAHIIKKGCHAILYPQTQAISDIVEDMCQSEQSQLRHADVDSLHVVRSDLSGHTFDYGKIQGLHIPLLGEHQLDNAAVALGTIEALQERGWHISEEAIRQGLHQVKWPCRLEIIHHSPVVMLDAAHNPQGAQVLLNMLNEYFPDKRVHLIFGCMGDKDYPEMLQILFRKVESAFFVESSCGRALPAELLLEEAAHYGVCSTVCETIPQAVEYALSTASANDVIVAAGTFKIMSDIKSYFNARKKDLYALQI